MQRKSHIARTTIYEALPCRPRAMRGVAAHHFGVLGYPTFIFGTLVVVAPKSDALFAARGAVIAALGWEARGCVCCSMQLSLVWYQSTAAVICTEWQSYVLTLTVSYASDLLPSRLSSSAQRPDFLLICTAHRAASRHNSRAKKHARMST